ncbi:hypothetical protein TURU_113433 [Turdus rufiventris]|nr:hypothetical protein TURU_113433 [Turdus rufiventris]
MDDLGKRALAKLYSHQMVDHLILYGLSGLLQRPLSCCPCSEEVWALECWEEGQGGFKKKTGPNRKENKPKPKVSKTELEEFIAGNEETEGDRNQKGGSPDDVPENPLFMACLCLPWTSQLAFHSKKLEAVVSIIITAKKMALLNGGVGQCLKLCEDAGVRLVTKKAGHTCFKFHDYKPHHFD